MTERRSIDPVRRASFAGAYGISATLTHYPPGSRHASHRHDFAQLSFVLIGEMHEIIGRKPFEIGSGAIGCKPAGCDHQDAYGADGTLIFAVNIAAEPGGSLGLERAPGWRRNPSSGAVSSLVRAAADAPNPAAQAEILEDLVALWAGDAGYDRSEPPPWLHSVRDEIRESDEPVRIAALAEARGMHRSQLSRLFRQHYRVPPSVYRLRCMAARAMSSAVASKSGLAHAAYDAGFADQSHLARTVKANVGLTLGRVKALLG